MASRSPGGNGAGAKQVVFLAMVGSGLAVVVFLIGVLVGRGVSIVDVITGQEAAGASAEGSFVPGEQPLVTSAAPRREPSMAATEGAGLSYYERLEGGLGPDLDTRLAPPAPAAPVAEAAPGPGPAAGDVPAGPGGGYAVRSGAYSVHVMTLREGAAAERMALGLVEKGYPAFVVAPAPDVPVPVFRVRVGTYANREEAELVLRRLEDEESFRPWITR